MVYRPYTDNNEHTIAVVKKGEFVCVDVNGFLVQVPTDIWEKLTEGF